MTGEPIEHPSDLTPLQRQYLDNIAGYLREPPTLGRIYARSAKAVLALLVVGGAAIGLCLEFDQFLGAVFVAGLFAGVFLRDFGNFSRAVSLWPATSAVLDRKRLAHLLAEPSPAPPGADDWE